MQLRYRNISSAITCLMVGLGIASAQTYQVGPEPSGKSANSSTATQDPQHQLGWGSNIGNARLARAAQLALQRGDHALARDYAQRAAQAAPNDPQLWFLLGYAARLDGKYGPSADAYQRGLHLTPSSIDGMSGLAQTYGLSGRTEEAERLLRQVVAADPRRRNDLAALGDIFVRTGNYTGAIEWLGRAERIEAQPQTELLLAISYEHTKQMDLASHYLELAKSHAPNNPDIDRSLSQFYRASGEYTKALDALLAIHNPKPDVVAELAFTYGLAGKPEDSARLYVQAANALPRDMNLQLSAAQAQVSLGTLEVAERFLQRAAALDPRYYRLHAIRGGIAQMQDRELDAVQEFGTAVNNLPASPVEGPLYGIQLHMNMLALYGGLDEPDLAHRQLDIAETQINALDERGSDRAAFLRLRALIRMDGGQLEPALKDMTESLALTPRDPNSLQLDGDLLVKMNRVPEAIAVFKQVLELDPHSRFALTSLGYASRTAGDDKAAEGYFNQLARNYPDSYVPYLALGDLYTANHRYEEAQESFARGFQLAPKNSTIVSGGMNAAIEAHDLPLAGTWQARISEKMAEVPQILREEERYFYFTDASQRSADIGRKAIQLMPKDRDVVVYLGYDLLRLEQYDELRRLTAKYQELFPKEADIPLLAGYVYKHDGELEKAADSFSEALRRDPEIVTAYTNRGYVLNDLREPERAAADFEQALKREPRNVEAHMGLAFAELNLHHPQEAIHQTELAEEVAGDSELIHTIRATAYGREGLLSKSATEYRAALVFDPKDGSLYLGLGNIFFAERRYHEAVVQLEQAERYLPKDAAVYALMARAEADQHNREQALLDVALAERYIGNKAATISKTPSTTAPEDNIVSDTYVALGEALNTLHEQDRAMELFAKALLTPNSDRSSVRFAIARLMAEQGHTADAERQIALAQMEVAAGDTTAPTGSELIEAAEVFQQLHEFELSETYLDRARAAGASDTPLRIALANSYLGLGETRRAAAELAAVKQTDDSEVDYQFLLAQASVYQQEHSSTQALSAFAEAASSAGEDPNANQSLLEAGASEGFRVNRKLSVLSNLVVQPIFEDSTVYVLDSKLNSPAGPVPITNISKLPTPRSSIETDWINTFHLHFRNLPTNGGFLQIRNAQGTISVPATNSIVHRNTTDYTLNFGLDPTVHLGRNIITFNSGVQGTLRRDTQSPIQLNENLFRIFTYATTTSFFNAVSADGYISAEMGPFTDQPVSERSFSGAINFRVGAPWSRTALITGWGSDKQSFNSSALGNSQDFNTSAYIGLTRRFSRRLSAEAIMEDLRAYRVVPFSPLHTAISQEIRPAGTLDFSPTRNWDIQAFTAYENTRGFHVYDSTRNGIAVSYTRPLDRTFNDVTGKVHLRYPIKLSLGIRQQTFLNFSAGSNQQFRPYVNLSIF